MLAYDVRDDYEIIEGGKFMAASPNNGHTNVVLNLVIIIGNYVKINRLGLVLHDNMDVHLPDGNVFRPDFAIIGAAKDKLIIDHRDERVHGVPDMVVEIFSRSTMRRDLTVKKDVYERNGVKEYWMIDPWCERISVCLLRDGKYELDEIYFNYAETELNELTDEERAAVKFEVPVAVLDGFKIKIKNIFGWYFE